MTRASTSVGDLDEKESVRSLRTADSTSDMSSSYPPPGARRIARSSVGNGGRNLHPGTARGRSLGAETSPGGENPAPIRIGRPPVPATERPITPVHRAILQLMSEGLGARDIAERLNRSEGTVRNQVRRIMERLPARNSTHAVAIAIRRNLIE